MSARARPIKVARYCVQTMSAQVRAPSAPKTSSAVSGLTNSLLAGAGGVGLAFSLVNQFRIFKGPTVFVPLFGALVLRQLLGAIVGVLKRSEGKGTNPWKLWYEDLEGGFALVQTVVTSFLGTLFGTWVAHLLKNDFPTKGAPLFYLTAPLWFYILAVHLTTKHQRITGA